jgi:hypothetical protein
MSLTRITSVEPGNRIQLPDDWTEALGLRGQVSLERTENGILIRPGPPKSWAEFFASKLSIGAPASPEEDIEVTGDDLLF